MPKCYIFYNFTFILKNITYVIIEELNIFIETLTLKSSQLVFIGASDLPKIC